MAAKGEMIQIVVGRDIEDTRKFGISGTIDIGKHIVGTGEDAHFTTPVLMDVLRPHLIVVCGKRGCVAKDTEILTDNGVKDISEFDERNDKVYSYDVAKDKFEWKPSELIRYNLDKDEKLVKLEYEEGSVTITSEHPLLILDGSSFVWKEARKITKQDKLISIDKRCLNINAIQEVSGLDSVYDLSVPETNSFIANGIISHNSGKSYTLGVFVEEMFKLPEEYRKTQCSVIIDTQGIFWTMKQPNEKDVVILNNFGLKPQGFPVTVYVPEGQSDVFRKAGVDFDGVFSISAEELIGDEWLAVFGLSPNESIGILLQRVVNAMRRTGERYGIDNIIDRIRAEKGFESEKYALENRFDLAKTWGIFGEARMPVILEPGKSSVLDVSLTSQSVRALLISIICKKIFAERTIARRKEELAETEGRYIKKTPVCWVLIDEAHNFISEEERPASQDILLRIVREGRQPGITLVLATQRPDKLNRDALAQCDLLLSHMLTSRADIDSLRSIMQTYMMFDITKYLIELPKMKGVAIILDDNSERIYSAYVRPRQSWHAGASPVARL